MRSAARSPDAEAAHLLRAGHPAEALPLAERAVAAKRTCSAAHGLLAMILLRLGRSHDARALIDCALGLPTGPAEAYGALAQAARALGNHDRARDLYHRATQLDASVPLFWHQLATCERTLGRLEAAEEACDRAIALDPRQYPCYLLRAELRVQTEAHHHIEPLERELARPGLPDVARVLLGYALGKELDDLGRYDEAFANFALAASTHRRHLRYDAALDEHKLKRITEVFRETDRRPAEIDLDSSRFVFIVGLPRSGTTLVERILTGLPATRSNGETDHFAHTLLSAASTVAASTGADVFTRAAAVDWRQIAAGYARCAGADGSDVLIIEKQPMNYLYLGAIHRALPQARLLLVSRSPLDSCFAMYRTLFGEAYQFSYDFQDLARYYAAYARLIDHWRGTLGESLHEIHYDQLVSAPQQIGAAAARACGLPWDDSALAVDQNTEICLTQSAAQVRRPIYRSSVDRWRHYRAHLGPLAHALRRCGVPTPEFQ
ncbi:MAG: sulfotransferase [Steroidobacteraceae bacterium]